MKKINEILAVVLLSMLAVLLAAVGLRLYDTYMTDRQIEREKRQQEEVFARNREAHDRVQEMRKEIEEVSGDREMLVQFLEEIRTDETQMVIPVSATAYGGMSADSDMTSLSGHAADMSLNLADVSGNAMFEAENGAGSDDFLTDMSGGMTDASIYMTSMSDSMDEPEDLPENAEKDGLTDNDAVSGNDPGISWNDAVSGNGLSISGNDAVSGSGLSISGNDAVSGNSLSISGNDAVSENSLTISGNSAVSENGLTISGNDTVSENSLTISGNDTVSGNMLDILSGFMTSKISLEERRKVRTSYEETLLVNWEDQASLEERSVDFSGKTIACLGDSITAAANLEGEEGYLSDAYPAVLKELLGAKEVYNLGVGGSSIGRYWSDPFVERYTQIPEDTDIIIVMGGTNDGFCLSEKEFGSLTERKPRTFCGDLDELMRGLREKYPDADIFFVTPLPNILHDYLMRERSYLLPQKNIADAIITLAAAYDFQVIDLYNSNILDSHDADIVTEYMPDGVHANRAGYRILAEHMAAEVLKYEERKAESLQ